MMPVYCSDMGQDTSFAVWNPYCIKSRKVHLRPKPGRTRTGTICDLPLGAMYALGNLLETTNYRDKG